MSILGIDIGGTKTIIAIAQPDTTMALAARIDTPRDEGPQAVLSAIEAEIHRLIAHQKEIMAEQPLGERDYDPRIMSIGIGCGGPLDREKGIIISAPNLPGWENLDLAGYFRKAFDAPVYIDNDVNLMAFGEARAGVAQDVDYMAYFNVGTGVGGGIVMDGMVYHGCGNAGEFGHQVIIPDGPLCTCGRYGCLEALCSGTSIASRALQYLEDCAESLIWDWAHSDDEVTAEVVAEAARAGDELSLKIWHETGICLGIGVANVVNILNPRMVVLGGGVMGASDLFLDTVRETVSVRAMAPLGEDVTIVPGALGDQAGIIGALHLALGHD